MVLFVPRKNKLRGVPSGVGRRAPEGAPVPGYGGRRLGAAAASLVIAALSGVGTAAQRREAAGALSATSSARDTRDHPRSCLSVKRKRLHTLRATS